MRRKTKPGLTLLIVLALFLAACSGSKPTAAPEPGKSQAPAPAKQEPAKEAHIRIAAVLDPKNLDPQKGYGGTEHQVLYAIYDQLIRFDVVGSLKPGLAESWEWKDSKTLILNLRTGVKFHDGTPFNAEAVKFNIARAIDPNEKTIIKGEWDVVASAEATSEYQVKINLKEPQVAFLSVLSDRSGMMISPAAAKKLGNEFGHKPVGAGPYILKEWVEGSHITLIRNPEFWEKGYPKADKLTVYTFRDQEPAVRALKSGDVDYLASVGAKDAPWVQSSPDFTYIDAPTIAVDLMSFNMTRPPLNDVNLRRAIQAAIDRNAILKVAYGGNGQVSPSLYPKGFWTVDPTLQVPAYDPANAKQYLQQSGYKGEKMTFVAPTDSLSLKIGQMVQQYLKDAGIAIELQPLSSTELSAKYYEKGEANGRIGGWSGRPDPDVNYFARVGCGGSYNAPLPQKGYCDPKVDALLADGRASTDVAARQKAYYALDRHIIDQALHIPLVYRTWDAAVRKNITGFEPYLFGKPFYRDWGIK